MSDMCSPYHAARAGAIFDNDRLFEFLADFFGEDTRDQVIGSARGKRRNEYDGVIGPGAGGAHW
jgi:hypothetical protein